MIPNQIVLELNVQIMRNIAKLYNIIQQDRELNDPHSLL